MTNLDSILKSRDITLATKVHLVKAMVFTVVMYECESRTIKKAECWRIDAFELWRWRRLLRVTWNARRSNQDWISILKEISSGCSLEGLMLKLKLQHCGHLMWKTDLLEKTLVLGKIEGGRRRGWQNEMVGWHHQLNGHEFEQALEVGDGQGSLACCMQSTGSQSQTRMSNWTELNWKWMDWDKKDAKDEVKSWWGVHHLRFRCLSACLSLWHSHCLLSTLPLPVSSGEILDNYLTFLCLNFPISRKGEKSYWAIIKRFLWALCVSVCISYSVMSDSATP